MVKPSVHTVCKPCLAALSVNTAMLEILSLKNGESLLKKLFLLLPFQYEDDGILIFVYVLVAKNKHAFILFHNNNNASFLDLQCSLRIRQDRLPI